MIPEYPHTIQSFVDTVDAFMKSIERWNCATSDDKAESTCSRPPCRFKLNRPPLSPLGERKDHVYARLVYTNASRLSIPGKSSAETNIELSQYTTGPRITPHLRSPHRPPIRLLERLCPGYRHFCSTPFTDLNTMTFSINLNFSVHATHWNIQTLLWSLRPRRGHHHFRLAVHSILNMCVRSLLFVLYTHINLTGFTAIRDWSKSVPSHPTSPFLYCAGAPYLSSVVASNYFLIMGCCCSQGANATMELTESSSSTVASTTTSQTRSSSKLDSDPAPRTPHGTLVLRVLESVHLLLRLSSQVRHGR